MLVQAPHHGAASVERQRGKQGGVAGQGLALWLAWLTRHVSETVRMRCARRAFEGMHEGAPSYDVSWRRGATGSRRGHRAAAARYPKLGLARTQGWQGGTAEQCNNYGSTRSRWQSHDGAAGRSDETKGSGKGKGKAMARVRVRVCVRAHQGCSVKCRKGLGMMRTRRCDHECAQQGLVKSR